MKKKNLYHKQNLNFEMSETHKLVLLSMENTWEKTSHEITSCLWLWLEYEIVLWRLFHTEENYNKMIIA